MKDEWESKDGESEVCERGRQIESEDESRTTVTYVGVVLHVHIWDGRGG